jgi:hypothetical protein
MIRKKRLFTGIILVSIIFIINVNLKSQQKEISATIPKGDGRPSLTRIIEVSQESKVHFYSFTGLKNINIFGTKNDLLLGSSPEYGTNNINIEDYFKYTGKSTSFEYSIKAGVSADFDVFVSNDFNGVEKIKYLVGAGYYDLTSTINIIMPTQLSDYKLRPGVNIGYRFREVSNFICNDIDYDGTNGILISIKNRKAIQGGGFFGGLSVQFDMREMQEDFQPVITLGYDNVFGSVSETKRNVKSTSDEMFTININEPYRFNFGFQIAPRKLFDFKIDIMQINDSPEYRMELCKDFSSIELALYSVLKEKTVLKDLRDSYTFMFGILNERRESYLKFCLSYDTREFFGFGFGFII